MKMNEYGLNAYKKVSSNKSSNNDSKNQRLDDEIRRENEKKRKLNEETMKQAKTAAKTGSWFEKKVSYTSEDVENAASQLKEVGLIKVPVHKDDNGQDSIYRRVAKFLVIIGVEDAARILPNLSEEQIEKIVPEIATIRSITPEEKEAILEEFNSLVEKSKESGGIETARTILSKAYGSVKADDIIQNSLKTNKAKPFAYLEDANADRIRILLSGESVGVQTIVLSQLEPKKAAAVINGMENDEKKQIILRMAKMEKITPDVLSQVDKSLHEKLMTQNTVNSTNLDGRGVLAQILKRMDPVAENAIISSITAQDEDLGNDLKKRLFTEEDFVLCDDRFLQKKLQDMSDEDIAMLIKGKSDDFRYKVLTNVSKARKEVILSEESYMGPVLKSESDKITSSFYSVLRKAWERGELFVEGRDEGEIYV